MVNFILEIGKGSSSVEKWQTTNKKTLDACFKKIEETESKISEVTFLEVAT